MRKSDNPARKGLISKEEFYQLFLVRATDLRLIIAETTAAIKTGAGKDEILSILGRADAFDDFQELRKMHTHGKSATDEGQRRESGPASEDSPGL